MPLDRERWWGGWGAKSPSFWFGGLLISQPGKTTSSSDDSRAASHDLVKLVLFFNTAARATMVGPWQLGSGSLV